MVFFAPSRRRRFPGSATVFQRLIYGSTTVFQRLIYGSTTVLLRIIYGHQTYLTWSHGRETTSEERATKVTR